jgi:hypothetical protein
MCSWWWEEEPPEACRAIYRNKQTEKTLHLVGCTLEMKSVLYAVPSVCHRALVRQLPKSTQAVSKWDTYPAPPIQYAPCCSLGSQDPHPLWTGSLVGGSPGPMAVCTGYRVAFLAGHCASRPEGSCSQDHILNLRSFSELWEIWLHNNTTWNARLYTATTVDYL